MPEIGRSLTGFLHKLGENSFFQLSRVSKFPWRQQDPSHWAHVQAMGNPDKFNWSLFPEQGQRRNFPSCNSAVRIQISIYCRASSGLPDLQTQPTQPAMPPQAGGSRTSCKHPASFRQVSPVGGTDAAQDEPPQKKMFLSKAVEMKKA